MTRPLKGATLFAMQKHVVISLVMFSFLLAPAAYAKIIINEVAWMGTSISAQDEWIELYSDENVPLAGWTLSTLDGGLNIRLRGTTTPNEYYLIERTDDTTLPDHSANLVASFGKGLSNDGEILLLKNPNGEEVDRVDGSNKWAIGGDLNTKETLQRTASGWITAVATPAAPNALAPVKKVLSTNTESTKLEFSTKTIKNSTANGSTKDTGFKQSTSSVLVLSENSVPFDFSQLRWLAFGVIAGAMGGGLFLFFRRG